MINSNDIKDTSLKKYLEFLRSLIEGHNPFPIAVRGNKKPGYSLSEFSVAISDLKNNSKEFVGQGYSVEFKSVNTKKLGRQSIPVNIFFESEADYVGFLGKENEVINFKKDLRTIISTFPELKTWAALNPTKIVDNTGFWGDLLTVCAYFKDNPKPNLYIRELPINIHTKFIENNKPILESLLNTVIGTFVCENANGKSKFEKRFNLKYSEPVVRIKVLDPHISKNCFSGISDVSIPLSQFEKLDIPVETVIVLENKTTLEVALTLPLQEDSIAIFGSGFSVLNLKNVDFLNTIKILYWGDIDTHGFEILSQLRGYFPHVRSVCMDLKTLNEFYDGDDGPDSNRIFVPGLTKKEHEVYKRVKESNERLEQEKIPLWFVEKEIKKFL